MLAFRYQHSVTMVKGVGRKRHHRKADRLSLMEGACLSAFIVFCIAVLLGCQEGSAPVRSAYKGVASDGAPVPVRSRCDSDDSISCQMRGDTLIVTHHDARYQCCLESRILVHKTGTTLDIVEYDVGQPCDCMCTFDLTTVVSDLPPGTYTVHIWNETGRFYGACEPTVPLETAERTRPFSDEQTAPPRRWWYRSIQTGCKEDPRGHGPTRVHSYRMRQDMHGTADRKAGMSSERIVPIASACLFHLFSLQRRNVI